METWTWALGQGGTIGAHIAGCPTDPWVQQGLPEPKVDPRGSSDYSRGLSLPSPLFPLCGNIRPRQTPCPLLSLASNYQWEQRRGCCYR